MSLLQKCVSYGTLDLGEIHHRNGQIQAAPSQSHSIPNHSTCIVPRESRRNEQACEKRQRVERIHHRNGSPCDTLIGKRRKHLGSIGRETIEQDVGQETPKKQPHPTFQIHLRRFPASFKIPRFSMPPKPVRNYRNVHGYRPPRAR